MRYAAALDDAYGAPRGGGSTPAIALPRGGGSTNKGSTKIARPRNGGPRGSIGAKSDRKKARGNPKSEVKPTKGGAHLMEACNKQASKQVQKSIVPKAAMPVTCPGNDSVKLEPLGDKCPTMAALRKMVKITDTESLGVGRDVANSPNRYQDIDIVGAWKVHNMPLSQSYIKQRCVLGKRIQKEPNVALVNVPVPEMNKKLPGQTLEIRLNEKYFFHGTKSPKAVEPILCAGLNRGGGLFGEGVYLADRPEKFDQYTTHTGEVGKKALDGFAPKGSKVLAAKGQIYYAFVVRAILGRTFEGTCDCDNCQAEARQYPFLTARGTCMRCGRLALNSTGAKPFVKAHLTFEEGAAARVKGVEPTLVTNKLGVRAYASTTAGPVYDSLYAKSSINGCIRRYNEVIVPIGSGRINIEYVIAYQRCKAPMGKGTKCDPVT